MLMASILRRVLIWQGVWWNIALSFVSALMGCMAIGSALMGFMLVKTNLLWRVILMGSAFLLIMPGYKTDLVGAAVLAGVIGFQWVQGRRSGEVTA